MTIMTLEKRGSSLSYIFVELTCFLLIILFLYTGLSKLVDFSNSYSIMLRQPLPKWLTPILAFTIPISELLLAFMLITPSLFKTEKYRKWGLYGSFILMSLFSIYVGAAYFKLFDRVPCNCGGIIKSMSWSQHLVFNLTFTFITGLSILFVKRNKFLNK